MISPTVTTLVPPGQAAADQGRRKQPDQHTGRSVCRTFSQEEPRGGGAVGLPWSAEGPEAHPQGGPRILGAGSMGAHSKQPGDTGQGSQALGTKSLHFILQQGAAATLQSLPAPRAFGLCLLSFPSQPLAFPLSPSAATSNHRPCFPVSLGDPGLSELSSSPWQTRECKECPSAGRCSRPRLNRGGRCVWEGTVREGTWPWEGPLSDASVSHGRVH